MKMEANRLLKHVTAAKSALPKPKKCKTGKEEKLKSKAIYQLNSETGSQSQAQALKARRKRRKRSLSEAASETVDLKEPPAARKSQQQKRHARYGLDDTLSESGHCTEKSEFD